jgi:hypothetical protein
MAIKRIEPLRLDGKLKKADAVEGAAYLFLPIVLVIVWCIRSALSVIEAAGAKLILGGVLILVGFGLLALSTRSRK